jgi:hypothetical protein
LKPSFGLHDWLYSARECSLGNSMPSTVSTFLLYASGDSTTSQMLAVAGSRLLCNQSCRLLRKVKVLNLTAYKEGPMSSGLSGALTLLNAEIFN